MDQTQHTAGPDAQVSPDIALYLRRRGYYLFAAMTLPFIAGGVAMLVKHGLEQLVFSLMFVIPSMGLAYLVHRDWRWIRPGEREPFLELDAEGVRHRGLRVARYAHIRQVRYLVRRGDGTKTYRLELSLVEDGVPGHTVASLYVNGLAKKDVLAVKALIEQRSPIDWNFVNAPWWKQVRAVLATGAGRPVHYV